MIAMTRRDKENYYLDIAEAVASRGTCLRRNFGAIIVKNDQIVATGLYRRAPGPQKLFRPGLLPEGENERPPGPAV